MGDQLVTDFLDWLTADGGKLRVATPAFNGTPQFYRNGVLVHFSTLEQWARNWLMDAGYAATDQMSRDLATHAFQRVHDCGDYPPPP